MLPMLGTTLHIVRDILWSTKTRYDASKIRFVTPPEPTEYAARWTISEQIFDYPDFEPFRYAYVIINDALDPAPGREPGGGELGYSLEFKVISESPVADSSRSISLRSYVK
jgi:hypothetical protein